LNADHRKLLKIMLFTALSPLDRNGKPLAIVPNVDKVY
jgi:hypothetical protein